MTVDPRIALIREWRRTSDPDDDAALRALVLAVADIVAPPADPDSPDVPVFVAPTGAHDAYRPGAVIRYADGVYRNISDTFLTHSPADYPRGWERQDKPADPPKTPVWKAGVTYKTGDLVDYKNVVYRCIAGHTSMVGWEPDAVPALWADR